MNTVLFITSHLGARHNRLVAQLNEHPRILIHSILGTYSHIGELEMLVAAGHKSPGPRAIYGDHLLYNYQFYFKPLLKWCKFIYLIRNPKDALESILAEEEAYTPHTAFRYYAYRLRRICEMAKRTPGAVLLRWRDMVEGEANTLVRDYLKVNDLDLKKESADETSADSVPYEIIRKAEDCYERHFYYLKHLELRRAF